MTRVVLHGLLGKKFGENHSFFVRKPIDAIKALMVNKQGFEKALRTWGREGKGYQMICDGETIDNESELVKNENLKQIDIVPVIFGTSDTFKIIIGAILMVVAIWNPMGWAWLGAQGFGGMSVWANAVFAVGMTLVTSGIMGLLYPPPTPSFESSPQAKSFMFSNVENSQVQGPPVPVGYGRLRIGSKVISTNLRPSRLSEGTMTAAGAIGGNMGAQRPYHYDLIEQEAEGNFAWRLWFDRIPYGEVEIGEIEVIEEAEGE